MKGLLTGTTVVFLLVAPLAGSAGARLTMLILAAGALAAIAYRDREFVRGPLPRAVLAALALWAGIAIASVAWSVQPRYSLGELQGEILYGALAFSVFFLAARSVAFRLWHGAILAGALLVLAVTWLDHVLPIQLTRHDTVGQGGMWSTHLVLVAPFVLAIGWPGMWNGTRGAVIQAVAILLLFAAAWQTGNRIVWIALAAQLAVATVCSRGAFPADKARTLQRILLIAVAVVVAAFAFAIKSRLADSSPGASLMAAFELDVRPHIWAVAWDRFRESPWLGHGFGREIVADAFASVPVPQGINHPPVRHAHNVFFDMALELGAVGLAAFIAALAVLARQYRLCFRDAGTIPFGILGLTLLTGFVLKNLTDDFLHRHNSLMFWAMNGMLLGLVRPRVRGNDESSAVSVPQAPPGEASAAFKCNVCGAENRSVPLAPAENRETPSCRTCGSTLRMRSLMYLLSMDLYRRPLAVPEFPVDRRVAGLGMSDWEGYAAPLAGKFSYVNTFYHREPRLDISAIPDEMAGTQRFVVSSDVFEHIPHFALDAAFRNARRLLADDGCFIFSVPYRTQGETLEYFPRMHDFRIVEVDGRRRLLNTTVDGELEQFDDLDFHGGEGMTLAMRLFSESDLRRRLAAAGFASVRVHGERYAPFGILWPMDHSLPIVARAR